MQLPKFLLSATFLSSAIIFGQPHSVQAIQLSFASSPQPIEINRLVGSQVASILAAELHRFNALMVAKDPIATHGQTSESRFSFDSTDPLAKKTPQASELSQLEDFETTGASVLSDSPSETLGGVYTPEVVTGSKHEGLMVDPETRFW